MAYGTVKVDTIIFDQGGADQNVTVSGIYRAITSGVTVTGTISGAVLIGTTTVSGATVTGTQSSFTSGNFVTLSGVTATFTSGVIASGTAAAPSLSIVSDPNTGLYSPGADQVALATAGTGRLFVDSSGRVGIGTTSPGYALHVVTSGTTPALFQGAEYSQVRHSDGTRVFYTQVYNNEARLFTETNTPLLFGVNNTERLRIDSSGRVGIGTSSPNTLLHVLGGDLKVQRDSISFESVSEITLSNVYRTGRILSSYTNPASITETYIAFHTNRTGEANDTVGEAMRIAGGNVGIGTSSPVSRLHLAAAHTLAASSQLVLIQNTTTGEPASLVLQAVADNGGVGNTGAIYFDAGATGVTSDNSLQFTAQHQETITPAMTLTGLGRLGIGTSAPTAKLHVETIPVAANQSGSVLFGPDTSYGFEIRNAIDGSGFPRVELRAPTAGNGPILFFAGGSTERVRIDNVGRLLVGSSSARNLYGQTGVLQTEGITYESSGINLILNNASTAGPLLMLGKSRGSTIGSNTIVQNGDTLGSIYFCGADGSDLDTPGGGIYCEVDGTPGGNDMPGRLVFSTTADGAASPTERMRITNGGNVLFNATAVVEQGLVLISYNGGVNQGAIFAESDTTSGNTAIRFKVAGSTVGSITTTSSATAYNTSSDYRLKENVTAVTDGITRLQQLKPSRFNFIADPNHTVDGFIAHEVQDIVPEAITGEKDAEDDDGNFVYQGIDQSKLVPLLTAALQEAIGKIETLEARLTAAGID